MIGKSPSRLIHDESLATCIATDVKLRSSRVVLSYCLYTWRMTSLIFYGKYGVMMSCRGMDVMKSYATISASRDGCTVMIDDIDDRTVMTDDIGPLAYCNTSPSCYSP
jgi:hypothetical protein